MGAYTNLATNLRGMVVTGVTRRYNQPPAQLSTADLPAQYPRSPSGETAIATLSGASGLSTVRVDLVIVIEPAGQNTNGANFTTVLTLLDALNDALATNALSYKLDRWTIRQEADAIGDTLYWMLIAEVEASE